MTERSERDHRQAVQGAGSSAAETGAASADGERSVLRTSDLTASLRSPDVQLSALDDALVQLREAVSGRDDADHVHRLAADGLGGSGGTLPHLDTIQRSFGSHDVSGVDAHVGGPAAGATAGMGALAYTSGDQIAFGRQPDLHTAAHEAAHVVQQRQGVQLTKGVGRAGDVYERHADAVADAVVQGKSAEALLEPFAGGASGGATAVQRETDPAPTADEGGTDSEPVCSTPDPEADVARFRALVGEENIERLPDPPEELYPDALSYYTRRDPRAHTVIAELLGVPTAGGPGPDFIAAVVLFQLNHSLGADGVAGSGTRTALRTAIEAGEISGDAAVLDAMERDGARPSNSTGVPSDYSGHLHEDSFLGMGWVNGVNSVMRDRLSLVQDSLRATFREQLAAGEVNSRIDGSVLADNDEGLRHWVGIRQSHIGWGNRNSGFHRSGSAMDINYNTNPWMAVRTGRTSGGEGPNNSGILNNAVEAYDRAMSFMHGGGTRAHVHAERRPDGADEAEVAAWAGRQWDRFQELSQTISNYFNLVYDRDVAQQHLVTYEDEDERGLLKWSGGSLLGGTVSNASEAAPPRPDADAEANVQAVINEVHGGCWESSASDMVTQIRTDFRTISLAMVVGNQSESAGTTRNPLLGMFDLSRELVMAMTSVGGLYWGACELGTGDSGDMMHFDLGFTPPVSDLS